jgi:hypothetical protein
MSNILTAAQAANFIRTSVTDAVMLQLLPLVDDYIKNATGHDWASDANADNTAVVAAGMLLTFWYDNPSMVGQAPLAVRSTLMQLEAKAMNYRKYQFNGGSTSGSVALDESRIGDVVIKLIGVYGVSGDQSSKFESIITVDGQIQQTNSSDLSDNQYVVVLKHPAEDVSA